MMSRRKNNRRVITAAVLIIAAVCILAFGNRFKNVLNPVAADDTEDFVKILDVGQGDSALIYSNGKSALIDMGLGSFAEDICQDLDAAGITEIDVALVSHLHMDHAGGIPEIAKQYNIKNLILPELDNDAEAAEAIKNAKDTVKMRNGKIYTAVQGMNFDVGEFEITVLAYYSDMSNENNRSVVIMAEIDGRKFLFTGDAEDEVERQMLNEGINVDCDVIKVGHHGSNSSSHSAFIKKASPQYALISVGEGNIYSHPSKKVTDLLSRNGAEVYRTDKSGDIFVYVEKGNITVKTEN